VARPIGSPLVAHGIGSPPVFDSTGNAALPFQDHIDNETLRFNLLPDKGKANSRFTSLLMKRDEELDYCQGQWVDWYPGSVWDTYAYQQHQEKPK
jgi:hypothetical protein